MWDRWRQSVVGRNHDRRPRTPSGPADLSDLPALPVGDPGGLAAVDPALMGRYLGQPVAQVERLGGPASGATGVPEQHADQETRLRADGLTDEQIRLTQARAQRLASDQQRNGWRVTFTNGLQASVQVLAPTDQRSVFGWMRTRYLAERGRADAPDEADSLTLDRIGTVALAPYETYYEGGVLVARGRNHDALVKYPPGPTPLLHEIMAGLAALGVRVVEG